MMIQQAFEWQLSDKVQTLSSQSIAITNTLGSHYTVSTASMRSICSQYTVNIIDSMYSRDISQCRELFNVISANTESCLITWALCRAWHPTGVAQCFGDCDSSASTCNRHLTGVNKRSACCQYAVNTQSTSQYTVYVRHHTVRH